WNVSRGRPIRDGGGAITWWIGTYTDIDDMVRAKRALAASEDRWQALAGAGTEAIVGHDGSTVVDATRALADLFGYARDELVGLELRSLDGLADLGSAAGENDVEAHDRHCTRR